MSMPMTEVAKHVYANTEGDWPGLSVIVRERRKRRKGKTVMAMERTQWHHVPADKEKVAPL